MPPGCAAELLSRGRRAQVAPRAGPGRPVESDTVAAASVTVRLQYFRQHTPALPPHGDGGQEPRRSTAMAFSNARAMFKEEIGL